MNNLKTYCLFIFLIIGLSALANNPREVYLKEDIEERNFDKDEWTKLTKDLDYSDQPEEEKEPKEKKPQPRRNRESQIAMAQVLKVIAIIAAVGLLVFLLAQLMGAESLFSPKNRKIKKASTKIDIEDIEENIHEAEMDDFIQQAINEGNYPLAIRLYYLAILKELSLSDTIKWKKDKTNGEYLKELRGSTYFKDFREATLIFERLWYGKVESGLDEQTDKLEKTDFEILQPKFQDLLQKVSTSPN